MVTPSLADIANAGRDLAAIDGRQHGGRGVSLWGPPGRRCGLSGPRLEPSTRLLSSTGRRPHLKRPGQVCPGSRDQPSRAKTFVSGELVVAEDGSHRCCIRSPCLPRPAKEPPAMSDVIRPKHFHIISFLASPK